MMTTFGSGYLGSSKLETSKANQEVLPPMQQGRTHGYKLYKFSFMNLTACTISINYGDDIYLQANQGFAMDKEDMMIHSFVIREENVLYNWLGAFR